jgi:hypothetical protein
MSTARVRSIVCPILSGKWESLLVALGSTAEDLCSSAADPSPVTASFYPIAIARLAIRMDALAIS